MSFFTQISYSDSGSLDAFSRLRVSNPDALFSTQCQYNADPTQMEVGATGTGVTPSHSANDRMVALSATAGTGTSFIQSYQYSPYMPGKSQFIAITGVLTAGVAGNVVDTHYADSANGIIYRQNGASGLQMVLRSSTSGSPVETVVNQANWNIDPLNGSGPSGLTLDVTKSFIMLIDLQFLGMGRVRVGFDINGVPYYVHEFLNANNLTVPYMQTATLPIGMLLTATTTAAPKTCYFKCASVISEGGAIGDYGNRQVTPETTATAGSGTRVPLFSIRPKTTFNSIVNRELFIARFLNVLVTGVASVRWELVLGGNYGGQVWADVDTTYSAYEYTSTPGTFTNLTGGTVIASGYCAGVGGNNNATQTNRVEIDINQSLRYPLTLNRAGAVRAMGTLTCLVTGIGATSATRGSLSYIEIR